MNKRQLAHKALDALFDLMDTELGPMGVDFDLQLRITQAVEGEPYDEAHDVWRVEIVEDASGVAHYEEAARVQLQYGRGVLYNRDYEDLSIAELFGYIE